MFAQELTMHIHTLSASDRAVFATSGGIMSRAALSKFERSHGPAGGDSLGARTNVQSPTGHNSIATKLCRDTIVLKISDNVTIRIYELIGDEDPPPIVFGHGCGFAAGSYLSFLSALTGLRVFAFDARGHGGSSGPDPRLSGSFSIESMATDLARVGQFIADKTGRRPHYVGHSMNGATALWLLAFGDASVFSGFTLFEPAVFPPPEHSTHEQALSKHHRLISGSKRRRPHWEDLEQYASRLSNHPAFALWSPTMIRDHISATTRRTVDGLYELCCPPRQEKAILEGLIEFTTWDALPSIDRRIHLVSADPRRQDKEWMTTCMGALAHRLPNATLETLPGTHHLSMFARSNECRALVARHCARARKFKTWTFGNSGNIRLNNLTVGHNRRGMFGLPGTVARSTRARGHHVGW